ncbi:MAG: metallophosphoesterase [Bacilli bacterium]|nr:metallophosphoesterase [Bacilli bacterium]
MQKIYEVNYNISSKEDYDYILLSDLHGYFNKRIANRIKNTKTDFIVISGDLLNGHEWLKQRKLNKLKEFLSIIAEKHPIIICLGNHDLYNLNEEGLNNFKNLKEIKNVYPIYNESIILNNHRFTNFLPPIDTFNYLKQSSKNTINNLLKYLKDLEKVSNNSKYIEHLVSHNPYHFIDEKIIKEISNYDIIETGHFHDGWVPTKKLDKSYDKYIDKNIQELLISLKKSNSLLVTPKRNLSRGISYVYDDGYVVLLPNNSIFYYSNDKNEYHKKDTNYIIEKQKNKKTPALVISGAINTFGRLKIFYPYITHIKATKEKNVYKADRIIESI